jgi:hypothetical protein
MLLKGDVTTLVQKWGTTPRDAGSKLGLASDGQFSTRVVHAALDSKKRDRTQLLHFVSPMKLLGLKWMLIEAGKVSDTYEADYYPINH